MVIGMDAIIALMGNVGGAANTHGAAIAHNNHTKASQNSAFCNSIPQQRKEVQIKGMLNRY